MKRYVAGVLTLALALVASLLLFINLASQGDLLLSNLRYGGTVAGIVTPAVFFVASLAGASIAILVGVKRRWTWLTSVALVSSVLLVVGVIFLPLSFLASELGFGRGSGESLIGKSATATLDHLPPEPREGDVYTGLSRFTAEYLNMHAAARFKSITFVPADQPSTGPDVVSVNPIDDYTWGAAALSSRTGICYLLFSTIDPSNTRLGSTKHGALPRGSKCVGEAATKETVRDQNWPSAEELNS